MGLSNLLLLLFKNILSPITHGSVGVIVPSPQPYHIETFYYSILAISTFSVGLTYTVVKSRIGLAFTAIRDNQIAARFVGVNTTYYRLLGFAVSAFIVGIAGGFYAYYGNYVNPEGVFSPAISFEMLVMAFLGGTGTLWGPVVGAVLLYLIEEIGRSFIQQGFYILPAILLIIVFIFMPSGIGGIIKRGLGSEKLSGVYAKFKGDVSS